ncbi:uncharacterized protein CDAR_439691 [Caerostris darwini]|uniref:Uncharacterized protein n=1 Tax=Caerostris darwini TaxID=1538125 RepID=A0AAV4RWJ0_9ARAC|nr:uncharacterized protein CDAR_439691 [Caerostris darwini]
MVKRGASAPWRGDVLSCETSDRLTYKHRTFIAGLTVLCGCPTEYEDRCTAFLYNILASFLQLLTALIVVGWVWSIMWGITFVGISITKKEHDIVAASL